MQFSLYLFNPMHNAKYALKNNLGFNLENEIRVLTNDLDVPKLFFCGKEQFQNRWRSCKPAIF